MRLEEYLEELRSLPPEVPLEPELKPQRVKLDKRIREEQALASGAVLSAVLEKGEGGPSPQPGDLVYIQYSIRDVEDELLYSTRSEEGGCGQALAFMLEQGVRVPRGWEVAVKAMTKGERSVLQVKSAFGFSHPDCQMRPPARGIPTDQDLRFDLELVNWYPAGSVHNYGVTTALYKRSLREATSWESPRPPFEVTLHLTVCCPAYNGLQLTGQRLYSTQGKQPLTVQLGQGLLPPAVEEALSFMSRSEEAAFVVPAHLMRPAAASGGAGGAADGRGGGGGGGAESSSTSGDEGDVLGGASRRRRRSSVTAGKGRGGGGGGTGGAAGLLPAPPPRCTQVELQMELLSMVQVRDLTGTGEVTKKRVREGTGEFPIDCPLNDTTVRIHYRARPAAAALAAGGEGQGDGGERGWAYDTRGAQQEPIAADTGCGELPPGLEMCIKLMVPGELATCVAAPRFAYGEREDAPPGIPPEAAVEFEVELHDFEREGHWQNLAFEERYALADRLKAKGNELFKKQQYKFARARYERLLRLLDSTRDFETEEQVVRVDGYKVAVLGNVALAALQLGEHAAAVAACDKALEFEPENAKLHFRKGRALSLKGDHEEAVAELQLAAEHDPGFAKDVAAELAANEERRKAAVRKQKRDLGNFFKR